MSGPWGSNNADDATNNPVQGTLGGFGTSDAFDQAPQSTGKCDILQAVSCIDENTYVSSPLFQYEQAHLMHLATLRQIEHNQRQALTPPVDLPAT
jgi:hypothetical protein